MPDAPGAPLAPSASHDAVGDVRASGLLLFETNAPGLHVEPDALADALAELEEATSCLDALYAKEDDAGAAAGLFGHEDQQRGPDGRWTSGGGGGDSRVASAGSKDGLGRSKAAGEARTLSAAAKTASAAATGDGSHVDAAKAHGDAAAQHREAATRSARADYKAAHEMAAAAHEKAAEAHAEHASREARQADDHARGDRGNLHGTADRAAQAHQQAAAAQRAVGNAAAAKAHDQSAVRHVEGRKADEARVVARSADQAVSEKGAPLTDQERSGIAWKHDYSARTHEAAAKAFAAAGSTGRADRYAQEAKDSRARADYYKAGGDPHTEKVAKGKADRAKKVAAERDGAHLVLAADLRETRFCVPIALDASPAQGTAAETDPTAPRWIQVAAEGAYAKNGQQFTLDRAVFEQIVKNIRARASFRRGTDGWGSADVVPFDWRHASEMPPNIPGAFASQQALGWALDFDVRNGPGGKAQLWALSRFFPDVAAAIAKGAVKWTSIAVWPNATDPHGKPIGWDISSVALTNDPHIQGMVPIGACRFGRGDEISAAPAAQPAANPANREKKMDENLKALLIALGRHFNVAATTEAIQHHLDHQAPIALQRVALLEKGAADEPGRISFMKKLLADDGDGDGANAKDFDDAMKRVHGRLSARRQECERKDQEKAQLGRDRDGLMAELESMYGGEVKDEEDRVKGDVKKTLERNGLDPEKDEGARIAASGLLLERTGGAVMPPDRKTVTDPTKWLEATKAFLASRRDAAKKYTEKYPAPEADGRMVTTPAAAPHLFSRYFGDQGGAQPGPLGFMRGGGAPHAGAPIVLGNGGRPLVDGPQPGAEQGGLDFNRFLACAGRNEFEKARAYVISLDPQNARLEPRILAELARPIAQRGREMADAQGIAL